MTGLLEKAFAAARRLPAEEQDDLARLPLDLIEDDGELIQLTQEEVADLHLSEAEVSRGEFATEAEMRELWAKYDR